MIKLGTGNVTLYLGDKKVKAAWLGTEKVYPNSFLELSASSLSFAAAGQTQQLTITVEDGQTWSISGTPAGWSLSASSGTGPATVTVTAPNNTTASAKTGTLVVASEDLTASCALSQAAGVQSTEYTNWVTNSVTISANTTSVAAAGGSATLSAKASQSRSKITKWNGIETGRTTETQTPDVSTSATYSKVSGSGSVSGRTVTFSNNTSTNALSGVYRATYDSKTSNITISQAAGSKVYGAWTNVALIIDETSFAASGGSTTASVSIKRTYTWNGVAGSGGEESTSGSLNSPQASDSVVSFATAVSGKTPVIVASLGTTFKSATTITITAASAAATNRVSATITQAANYVTSFTINPTPITYNIIPARGGNVGPNWPTGTNSRVFTFSSGATQDTVPTSGGTMINGMKFTMQSGNGFTLLDDYTGWIRATSKGITVSGVTTSNTITYTYNQTWKNDAAYGGTSVSATKSVNVTCQQAANAATSITYGTPSVSITSVADISASGGTRNTGSCTYSQSRTQNYTSGSTSPLSALTSGGTVSWSTVSASSKGTTISNRSSVGTITCTVTMNGKSGSATATVYQAGNYVTALAHSGGVLTYSQISAAGGSSTANLSTQTITYTFTSGSTSTSAPGSTYGTYSPTATYSMTSGNGFSINTTNGTVTATSKGTTISNVTTSNTITRAYKGTWTPTSSYNAGGTKTVTRSVTSTASQAANSVSYGTPTGRTLTVSDILAAGGSVSSGTLGGTITQSRTFTSGDSDTLTNPTVSASSYSAAVSGANLGTTVKPRTAKGTLTYYYTCNGKQGSCSATVYQEANSPTVTGTTCDLTTLATNYKWTSGAVSSSRQENSYICGYRVTLGVGISIMQSGVMVSPVINTMRAYSCWGNTVQHQGTSYVDFPDPSFGENAATLTLNQSETSNHSSITYVLYQCNITYTDSGGTGALPNYVWSNAVTYSGSLAIYTAANAPSAALTVSAATRSTTSLQEDAENLLAQAESAGIELTDEIKAELTAIADGKE